MKHIKIEVTANDYQQEELIALLDDYKATGFEQTDEKLIAYFNEDGFDLEEVQHILQGYEHLVAKVEDRNWNHEWETNFQPVIVEDFVAVRAHFHQPITTVQQEIVITPKMSFGTGHHATTYMMMLQMRGIEFLNKTVFDFGTGTGILSILAEKLGAQKIIAIDNDEWSIENTRENIERNDCHKVRVAQSEEVPKLQFDIILANINRNVLLDYMPQLATAITHKATVLLSGLLVEDEGVISEAAVKCGLLFVNRMERNGWISLLFVNSK